MSIAAYLKEIGGGKQGARSLDAAQAEDLMRQNFDGRVNNLQLGAFAIAMRLKGESPAELAGFVAAAQAQFLAETGADALLLRGTEGEPVADARRTPHMQAFLAGQRVESLSVPAHGGVLALVPALPAAIDAASTATFISALPGPIQAQAAAIAGLANARHHAREQAA